MKQRGFKLWVLALLLVLVLVGCSRAQLKTADYAAPQASYAGESYQKPAGNAVYNTSSPVPTQIIVDRKVIMTARVELIADNLQGLEERVVNLVRSYGGHIQRSYFNNREGNQYWEFTLRIPTASFETSIQEISTLGKVQNSSSNGQDVTEEYMDLAARLRVLEQEENRLLELLTKASTIDDFLKVESHLSRVRVDIEQTTGRIKFLDNRLDLSTIDLHIRPVQGLVEPELKGFAGLAQQMKAAFMRGINGVVALIAGVLVSIAALVPFLVVVVPVGFVLVMLVKRRRNNRKPPMSM